VVAVTLVVGTSLLGVTLAAPSGSILFCGLGLLAAVTWIGGALIAGPVVWRGSKAGRSEWREIALPLALGVALFGVFVAVRLVAGHLPLLSGSVSDVLDRADTGSRPVVLAVALVNGIGEEMFFRGALYDTFEGRHAVGWTTAVYCAVTATTLQLSLVAAALLVGLVLGVERRNTRGVLGPVVTHLSWSTLMLLALPR